MPLKPGTVLQGRYQIERRIGAGGMGEVYRARDSERGAPVAVKIMLAELAPEDEEAIQRRFNEEVEVLGRLAEDGLPRYVDSFLLEGLPCIVMEFIEGDNLETLLEDYRELTRMAVPQHLVVHYAIQACYILESLHQQDPPVLHRDVKPANLIVDRDSQRLHLVDLGLARTIRQNSETTRSVVGTPIYAAIEQYQGHPVPASDQYSLGATMWHLLSGCAPTPAAPRPLLEVAPDVHPELAALVDRACQTELADRYPSILAMRHHLVRVLGFLREAGLSPQVARPLSADAEVPRISPPVTEVFELEPPDPVKSSLQGMSLLKLLLLGLAVAAIYFGGRVGLDIHKRQQSYAFFATSQAVAWECLEVRGTAPEGERLRCQVSDPGFRAGAFFAARPGGPRSGAPVAFFFELQATRDLPAVIVFLEPYGVLFERSGNDYQASLVTVVLPELEDTSPLNLVGYRHLHDPVLLGPLHPGSRFEVREANGRLELRVGGAVVQTVAAGPFSTGKSGSCGVVLPFPRGIHQELRVGGFAVRKKAQRKS
ncbi:MAG: serine/threonine protein kinase [Armatimonadetes bacterium]|nr:serine/threonine protein kinase [Armatimonadota bacterium]